MPTLLPLELDTLPDNLTSDLPDYWIGAEQAVLALDQAQRLCEQKQWQQALELSQSGLQWFEIGAAIGYRVAGWAAQEQGDYAAAEQYYIKARLIQPDNAETQARLGSLYADQAQWQAAIDCYQRSIELDPSFAGAYLKLGEAWQQVGEPTASALSYYQGFQLKPELVSAIAHAQLGDRLAEQNQWAAAVNSYRLALTLNPQQIETWLGLAQVLRRQGEIQTAIDCYQQAIAIHPTQPVFYTYLGNLLTQQGQPEAAWTYHRQASILRGWQAASERAYHFTSDWFTHNLADWRSHLQSYIDQPGVQILEVGSYEGMSACWFLDAVLTHATARLTTIDVVYATCFESNIAATAAGGKVQQLTGNSHDILPTLSPQSYDVIYIDGCHLAPHVRQDATLAWDLLKPAGLMIFDDYKWSDPNFPDQDPQQGIDAFLVAIAEQYELVQQAYQLVIRKSIPPVVPV